MQHTLQYNGRYQTVSITNYGKTVTNTKYDWATSTHSHIIPCDTTKKYQWKVKCVKCATLADWWIGLQDAIKSYDDTYFSNKDLSYCYHIDGAARGGTNRKLTEKATSGWYIGDILTLSYSPKKKKLSLSINNKKQAHTFTVRHNPNGYKMAISMGRKGDSAELMDFIVIGKNNGNEEQKESSLNNNKQVSEYIISFH